MTLKRCRLSLWHILWATQAGFEKFNPFLKVKEVESLYGKVRCHPQETLWIRHQASSLHLGDKDPLVWRFRPVTSERLIGWLVGWHWVGCRHSDSVWTVDSSGWQLRGSLVSGVYGTGAEREIWSAAWDEIKPNVPQRPQNHINANWRRAKSARGHDGAQLEAGRIPPRSRNRWEIMLLENRTENSPDSHNVINPSAIQQTLLFSWTWVDLSWKPVADWKSSNTLLVRSVLPLERTEDAFLF